MGTRIVEFGVVPNAIITAFSENGLEVEPCGTSIAKLKRALQRPDDPDAIALAEHAAPTAARILPIVGSFDKVPLILFQDESRTCEPSQFDLVIPEHTALPNLLKKVAALIERSRAIRAETEISGKRFRTLLRQADCLREQSVIARVESQHIRGAKFKRSATERVSVPCILVVDDYAQWRDTMCSILQAYVDCPLLCEAGDGIEAVQRARELKPQLILLDLDLPRLNGIEAARQIMHCSPDSSILFVSMNNCADVVCEALSTGGKGYVLKADAGNELWPAIETVLQNKQYLSRGLQGLYSVTIN